MEKTIKIEKDEDERLFVLYARHIKSNVWFVDSYCSNHMMEKKVIFDKLDETKRITVELGNKKELQVEGKGKIKVKTKEGKIKALQDV